MLSISAQSLLFPAFLRITPYEVILRFHQALSFLLAYTLWRHITTTEIFPRIYLYISAGIFTSACIIQLVLVLYRNRMTLSKARISEDFHAIRVRLHLTRPMKVEAGQYINIWILSASFWSFTQTHPFTVVSWSDRPQGSLDLFIQPRHGLTKDLFDLSEYGPTTCVVAFSGPHGRSLPLSQYENVVLIATGFGIAAHLPCLRKLIFDHNTRRTSVRRIHLVWQIEELGVYQLVYYLAGADRFQTLELLRNSSLMTLSRKIVWIVCVNMSIQW